MNHVLRVGLTGGIGSGKSTVSDLFSEHGVPVIDADMISRKLTQRGQPAYEKIVKLFGKEIVSGSGELRRDVLRKIIFEDVDLRRKLEAIIHPLVHQEIERLVSETEYPYCIISIPLLLETDEKTAVDKILVVDTPEKLQVLRAGHRDKTRNNEIKKIIQSQISRKKRLAAADDIISNDQDIEFLRKQVALLHRKYLQTSDYSVTDKR